MYLEKIQEKSCIFIALCIDHFRKILTKTSKKIMKNFKKLTFIIFLFLFSGLISPLYPCETGGTGS